MKRGAEVNIFILSVFFLTSVLFAHATETLLSTTDIQSYDTLSVGKRPFVIILEDDYKRIIARQNNFPYFIDAGKCQEITNLMFCFNGTVLDNTKNAIVAHVKVYDIGPKITVTRTANQTTLHPDETFTISVSLLNEGNLTAENFTFTDEFPPEFEIVDRDGLVTQNGTTLNWKGQLKPQTTETFSYTLRAVREFEQELKAKYSYFDGFEMQNTFTSAIAFTSETQFKITPDLDTANDELHIGDQTNLILKLTNDNGNKVHVHYLDIYLPKNMRFEKTDVFKIKNGTKIKRVNESENKTVDDFQIYGNSVTSIGDNVYRYSGFVRANPDKVALNDTYIVLKLRGIISGEGVINMRGQYDFNDEKVNHTIGVNQKISVTNLGLKAIFSFKEGDSYDAGQVAPINIQLINLNLNHSYHNLYARIDSPAWNESPSAFFQNIVSDVDHIYFLKELFKQQSRFLLKDKRILFTQVPEDRLFPVKVNISYQSEYGENFTYEIASSLNVKKIADLVVTQDILSTDLSEDEETTVTVQIQNERNAEIQKVFVNETFSKELSVLQGVTQTRMDVINPKATVSAYSYKIKMPSHVTEKKSFPIRTDVYYEEAGKTYAYFKETTLTVSPKKLDVSVTTAFDNALVFGLFEKVAFSILNVEDETLYNVTLSYTPQQNFDFTGNKSKFIQAINPGEKIVVKQNQILPKKNETNTLIGPKISFFDKEGRYFEKNETDSSVTMSSTQITENVYLLKKEITPASITFGDPVTVILSVTNLGPKESVATLLDQGREWNVSVHPYGTEKISYSYTPLDVGKKEISFAILNYTYLGTSVLAVSNIQELTIQPKGGTVPALEESTTGQEPIIEEIILENETETNETAQSEMKPESNESTSTLSEINKSIVPEQKIEQNVNNIVNETTTQKEESSGGFFSILKEVWRSVLALLGK